MQKRPQPVEYIHVTLFDILEALIDVVGELLPHADTQLPLQLLSDPDLAGEDVSQSLNLLLHLRSNCYSLVPSLFLSLSRLIRSRLTFASSALQSASWRCISSKDRPSSSFGRLSEVGDREPPEWSEASSPWTKTAEIKTRHQAEVKRGDISLQVILKYETYTNIHRQNWVFWWKKFKSD